jgi:hypothetical protein
MFVVLLRFSVNKAKFVSENIVAAEIIEITPSKADPRLGFLLPTA